MMMSDPSKDEYVRVNVAHITKEDEEKLRTDSFTTARDAGPIFLYICVKAHREWESYSAEFHRIVAWARELNVTYILFSTHAPCYNELKLFHR